jgi:hypothetical protein
LHPIGPEKKIEPRRARPNLTRPCSDGRVAGGGETWERRSATASTTRRSPTCFSLVPSPLPHTHRLLCLDTHSSLLFLCSAPATVSCRECRCAPLPVFEISLPIFLPDPPPTLSGYKKLQERLIELDVYMLMLLWLTLSRGVRRHGLP